MSLVGLFLRGLARVRSITWATGHFAESTRQRERPDSYCPKCSLVAILGRVAAIALSDVVCDFPFKSDAHRSAWIASLLTPLARYAFTGPAPLFLMDANPQVSPGWTRLLCVTEVVQRPV